MSKLKKPSARVAAEKTSVKAARAVTYSAPSPATVAAAIQVIEDASQAYAEECHKLRPNGEMPQRIVQVAALAQSAAKSMTAMHEAFKESALRIRARGSFQRGEFAVEFEYVAGRRTPSWKDEAISKARALAVLKGKRFNEERYVARVIDATPEAGHIYKPVIRKQEGP